VIECSSYSAVEVSFGYTVERWRIGMATGGGSLGVSQTAGKPNRNEGRCKNLPDTCLLAWPACENLHSLYDPVNIVWVTESR
jgi:hypothetical protein